MNAEENLFEFKENELNFKEICEKLKNHPFESPWKYCFPTDELVAFTEFTCGVHDLNISQINELNSSSNEKAENDHPLLDIPCEDNISEEFEMQLSLLKNSLKGIQEVPTSAHLNGIEILNNISLVQMTEVCKALRTTFSNETTFTTFLNAILSLQKSLSLSVASALIKHIIYPQVFHEKQNSSRTLLAAILKFSEIYPKPSIDEIIVPCLNLPSLETLQLETLTKMVKINLADEYVSYCIKNILENAMQIDHTFAILQNLIERKIHQENNLLEDLTDKVESWSLDCKKNVKFTKLVISILITYGSVLDHQQIMVYGDIIKNNQTIMKRAAENVIKQLKA